MHARETQSQRLAFRWTAALVLVGSVLAALVLCRIGGPRGVQELVHVSSMEVLVLGKFVIFFGLADGVVFGPITVAIMCVLIDLVTAVLLLGGLGRLEEMQLVGHGFRAARLRAMRIVAHHPVLERMAFFGVAGLVLLPLAASGCVTACFASRLVGLSRASSVLAVGIGTTGESVMFATLALVVGEHAETLARSPLLISSTLLAVLLVARIVQGRVTIPVKRPAHAPPSFHDHEPARTEVEAIAPHRMTGT